MKFKNYFSSLLCHVESTQGWRHEIQRPTSRVWISTPRPIAVDLVKVPEPYYVPSSPPTTWEKSECLSQRAVVWIRWYNPEKEWHRPSTLYTQWQHHCDDIRSDCGVILASKDSNDLQAMLKSETSFSFGGEVVLGILVWNVSPGSPWCRTVTRQGQGNGIWWKWIQPFSLPLNCQLPRSRRNRSPSRG